MVDPDAIVVGAGLSGAVFAERLASQQGAKVLVLEQRDHIAGNCHDFVDEHGVRVHRYGPHLFHTDNKLVWEYLSQFTDWHPYEHRVMASVDDQLIPLPFNLTSLRRCFSEEKAHHLEAKLLAEFGDNTKVPILRLQQTDDPSLRELADFIFKKIFLNYTIKQWGKRPDEISSDVMARVPVNISHDDRYFQDKHQALPANGYNAMVSAMLEHKLIEIRTNTAMNAELQFDLETNAVKRKGKVFKGTIIYTGMLDELFECRFGPLPYRSLQFEFEHLKQDYFQPVTTVNYPNHPKITRITEFKHLQPDTTEGTTIVREHPQDYDRSDPAKNIPYYPITSDENLARHDQYLDMAAEFENLIILGRLADYKYYDMDDAVAAALAAFEGFDANNSRTMEV